MYCCGDLGEECFSDHNRGRAPSLPVGLLWSGDPLTAD